MVRGGDGQKGGNERWLIKTAKKKRLKMSGKITETTDGTIQGSEKDAV